MAPAVLAALIAGGSSLIGGGLSAIGQASTNKFNALTQQKLMEAQNRFNLEQWNRSNEYNTPANQRKRLEEAGINPALALSNITPGITQAVTSASGEGAPRAENALGTLGQGVASGGAQIAAMAQQQQLIDLQKQKVEADIAKTQAETQGIETDNETRKDKNEAELANVRAQTDSTLYNVARQRKFEEADLKKLQSEALAAANQADYIQAQTLLAEFELKHTAPAKVLEIQAKIKSLFVTMAYIRAQTQLSYAQKELLMKKALTETLQQDVIAENAVILRKTQRFVEEKIKSEIKSKDTQSRYYETQIKFAPVDRMLQGTSILLNGMANFMSHAK